mgnify:CR=1 FL=1
MKNSKKLIISLCISLVILGVCELIYSKTLKENEVEIKVATEDIYKGETISEEIIKRIKIKKNSDLNKYGNVDVSEKVASRNILAGKILEEGDVSEKIDNKKDEENYEYVTIEVKNISDGLAYQLKKGDKVNLYYTVKDKQINAIEQENNIKNSIENIKTIRLIEHLEVINVFDASGNVTNDKGIYSAIMFRVTENQAITIANIKSEGTFSVTLIK